MSIDQCFDDDFQPYYIEKVGEYMTGGMPMFGVIKILWVNIF